MSEREVTEDEFVNTTGRFYRKIKDLQAQLAKHRCEWKYDEYHCKWDTGCGEAWTFIDDGPKENKVKFCMYCGGKIPLPKEKSDE